jgi:hypothetical protein
MECAKTAAAGFPSGLFRPAALPLTFESLDLAFHDFTDELGTPIWADQIVDPLRQSLGQANDSSFNSERRSSHPVVVATHHVRSISS